MRFSVADGFEGVGFEVVQVFGFVCVFAMTRCCCPSKFFFFSQLCLGGPVCHEPRPQVHRNAERRMNGASGSDKTFFVAHRCTTLVFRRFPLPRHSRTLITVHELSRRSPPLRWLTRWSREVAVIEPAARSISPTRWSTLWTLRDGRRVARVAFSHLYAHPGYATADGAYAEFACMK